MKQIELKTSKGEFIIIELDENLINNISRIEGLNLSGKINCLVEHVGFIENITEDQAKNVVDDPEYTPCNNCQNGCPVCSGYGYSISWINELYSLLKVNGVCFESTYPDYDQALKHYETDLYWEAKSKVWNKQQTYLFKKI